MAKQTAPTPNVDLPFRTAFSPSLNIELHCNQYSVEEEQRTKPEFLDDCDINRIMKRFDNDMNRTGWQEAAMQYGDFTQIPDFMEMQHKVIAAHELFDALPSAVRKQFNNNPAEFLAAADTKEGRELMKKLGLGKEPQEPSKEAPQAAVEKKEPAAPTAPVKNDAGGNKPSP